MLWKSRSRLRSDPQRSRPVGGQVNARRTARPPSAPARHTHFDDADVAFLAINVSFLAFRRTHSPGQKPPSAGIPDSRQSVDPDDPQAHQSAAAQELKSRCASMCSNVPAGLRRCAVSQINPWPRHVGDMAVVLQTLRPGRAALRGFGAATTAGSFRPACDRLDLTVVADGPCRPCVISASVAPSRALK